MTRGRKPQPTRLRLLKGNTGRRRPNNREPSPTVQAPPRPDFLSGPAAEKWDELAPYLVGLRLMTIGDGPALAALCQAWGRYCAAEKQLAEQGPVVTSPNGYGIPSPWLAISNQAHDQMRKLLTEFGLTPSSRSRVEIVAEPKSKSKLAAFMEGA